MFFVAEVMIGLIPQWITSTSEGTVPSLAATALKAVGVEGLPPSEITTPIVVLDIVLDAPLGILPQNSENPNCLMADLGKAKVEFHKLPAFHLHH